MAVAVRRIRQRTWPRTIRPGDPTPGGAAGPHVWCETAPLGQPAEVVVGEPVNLFLSQARRFAAVVMAGH
jgi:hypothetical protein